MSRAHPSGEGPGRTGGAWAVTSGADPRPRRRLGLRATIMLGTLVPLLGLTALGGLAVDDRLDSRSASTELEERATELADIADFLAGLAREEAFSTIIALTSDLELEDGAGASDLQIIEQRLRGARATVDSARFAELRDEVGLDSALSDLRADVDARRLDLDGAARRFTGVDELLETVWGTAMDRIERTSDEEPLPASIRAQVRSLRESVRSFSYADERIQPALSLMLGRSSTDGLRALLEATSGFNLSKALAEQDAGPGATARWAIFADDPAVQRTEGILELAVGMGAGEVAPFATVDADAWVQGLTDGAVWATRLTEVVRAAALDLREVAAARADGDGRAVALHAALIVALGAASAVVAAVIARRVARPASALERAARRVEAGELQLPALQPNGPRELAATVQAFNDMASTLAAVERHTIALAEALDAAVLEEPLPGRTGQAMQQAMNRLRDSVQEAEVRRVELYERATHDGLTGLVNRASAFAAIERELARIERSGGELLALYVDLDGLKELNDRYGHEAGDEAIVRTAAALRATTRDADIVARLGGDEFLVVGPLPPEGPAGIHAFAERVHAAVALQAVEVDGGLALPLRCSIGAARTGPGGHSADTLVRAADVAMYRAKRGGRDRVVVLDSTAAGAASEAATEV